MKIQSSGITMGSSHALETHTTQKQTTMETLDSGNGTVSGNPGGGMTGIWNRVSDAVRSAAAVYEGSGTTILSSAVQAEERGMDGATLTGEPDGISMRATQQGSTTQQRIAAQGKPSLREPGTAIPSAQLTPADFDMRNYEDLKTTLLRRMLDLLNGKKPENPLAMGEYTRGQVLDLRSSATMETFQVARLFAIGGGESGLAMGTTASGTVWERVTTNSTSHTEAEATAFRSQGFAVTEDGRSLHFDVELSMSRSFTSQFQSISSEKYLLTDPLIINLDRDITSVSDVKFSFDLDSDGKQEWISFAGEGSGFLALDANENGAIDDGSELFGTQSGDGFGDLAAYDTDGNHWIDENDAVYSRLRVWTKDTEGNDQLRDLKEANVGAIYLGSASTEFSLNDAATNETNAVIRRTGIYLRETGEVGTLSHVDLKC